MDTTRCEMPNDLRLLTGSIAEAIKETNRPRQLHSQVCEEAGTQVLHTRMSVLHGPPSQTRRRRNCASVF